MIIIINIETIAGYNNILYYYIFNTLTGTSNSNVYNLSIMK